MAPDVLSPLIEGMPANVRVTYHVLPSAKRTAAPYGRRAREHGNRPAARARAQLLRDTGRPDS